MKDKLIKAALSFAVVCVLGACTKNYLDINSNPYEVDKEQMEAKDYAIASGLSAMFGTVVSTDVNTAQFTDCLLGSTQGGYYAEQWLDEHHFQIQPDRQLDERVHVQRQSHPATVQ